MTFLNEIPYDGGIQVKCQAYKVKIDGRENNIEDANPAVLSGWLPSFYVARRSSCVGNV